MNQSQIGSSLLANAFLPILKWLLSLSLITSEYFFSISSGSKSVGYSLYMICFVAEIARGEHFSISLAISLALFNISFAGTISLINPKFLASVLFINFPVNKRLSASFCGISFAILAAPPAPANNPTFGSGNPKVDLSEAINISQESAISKPPHKANPFIAAIIGL